MDDTQVLRSPRFSLALRKKKKVTSPVTSLKKPLDPLNMRGAGERMSIPPETFRELSEVLSRVGTPESSSQSQEGTVKRDPARHLIPCKRSASNPEAGDPLAEIRVKLLKEEATLMEERARMRMLIESPEEERGKVDELKARIKERMLLIDGLKQNLSLHNEHLISNGLLKMRKLALVPGEEELQPVSYWALLEFPMIKFFRTEWVR